LTTKTAAPAGSGPAFEPRKPILCQASARTPLGCAPSWQLARGTGSPYPALHGV